MARAVETIVTAQLCKWRPAPLAPDTLTQRGLRSCEPFGCAPRPARARALLAYFVGALDARVCKSTHTTPLMLLGTPTLAKDTRQDHFFLSLGISPHVEVQIFKSSDFRGPVALAANPERG
jgi:hypothetical protein